MKEQIAASLIIHFDNIMQKTARTLIGLIVLLGIVAGPVLTPKAHADLPTPEACTGQITDMMTDGMVFMYMNTAWMCMGICDQAMGVFFMEVLESKNITMEFMECAEANPELIDVMIRITDRNDEVLERMGELIRTDCEFAEQFVSMATWWDNLRGYFFYALNDQLYNSLTYAMLCEPPELVRDLGEIMVDDLQNEMKQARPFWEVFMNLANENVDTDANEMADERMLYSFMRDPQAATYLFSALNTLEEFEQNAMLQFMFNGQTNNRAGDVIHPNQSYYNTYAMIEAFVTGIAPLYDHTLPPDPNSSNQANALLGKMLQMLVIMDAEGNVTGMTPYAQSFFQALRSGAEIHCDPYSMGMMEFMGGLFPPELFGMLPPAVEDSPGPRDFKRDGAPLFYTCPEPTCGPRAPQLCDQASCTSMGMSWCDGACVPAPSCGGSETPVCGPEHPELCDQASCTSMGMSWCDGACVLASSCGGPDTPTCGPEHLELCDQASCNAMNMNWCGAICVAEECAPPTACGPTHPELCDSAPLCAGAGHFWCDEQCQPMACSTGDDTGTGTGDTGTGGNDAGGTGGDDAGGTGGPDAGGYYDDGGTGGPDAGGYYNDGGTNNGGPDAGGEFQEEEEVIQGSLGWYPPNSAPITNESACSATNQRRGSAWWILAGLITIFSRRRKNK